jgi:hypothetical protein
MITPVINDLLNQLKLKRDALYNFLKYIRNTKDAASLGLNPDNVVSIIKRMHHEVYPNHCESYDNFMYLSYICLYFQHRCTIKIFGFCQFRLWLFVVMKV